MDSVYFKELKSYEESYLLEKLGEIVFNKLLKNGFLKEDDGKYKFNYVGLIILKDIIINCYPKYIDNDNDIITDFKQIVKVIKHYNDKKGKLNNVIMYGLNNLDDISFNIISVMLFFIEDYFENGVYTKYQNILQINGTGEIDWNRTVNETFPIIIENIPYYTELQTKEKYNNLFDYFRLLHEYIITDCSNYLKNTGLLDIFGLTSVELSENSLDNFGNKEFILNKIMQELNVEFNTQKRKLLQLMYSYIKHKNSLTEDNSLIEYGTRSYYLIWEDMCKEVFNDLLEKKLCNLFPDKNYNPDETLLSIIENPKWILDKKEYIAKGTLIPDIITFYKNEDNEDEFIILDAKYYYYDLKGDRILHQPGIGSITKQYLYQLAYKKLIKEMKFDKVKNAFLLPKSRGKVENKGKIVLNILSKSCLDLEDIYVILLPAGDINQRYLDNKKMDISRLDLQLEKHNGKVKARFKRFEFPHRRFGKSNQRS